MSDSPHSELASTPAGVKYSLWGMMFLQYFIHGSFLPVISVYLEQGLGFTAAQLGYFGSAMAVGPVLSAMVVGQVVDRHFRSERVLSALHALAAVVMFLLYKQTEFLPILILGALYSVLYVPSMFLTNSIAFQHLVDREKEFPLVRLWGTIGFIVPLWVIESWWLRGLTGEQLQQARSVILLFAAAAGVVMALYSQTLPTTRPQRKADRALALSAVGELLPDRRFSVLLIVAFGVAIVHKFYFVWNSPFLKATCGRLGIEGAWEGRIGSIGQFAEIAVMAGLGLLLKRVGFKLTLGIGLAAYMLRCLLFTAAAQIAGPAALVMTVVCVGQALHGFCFACFFAASFILIDRIAPPDARGSLQNFYGTVILGLGALLGGVVSGEIGAAFSTEVAETTTRNWQGIWLSGAALAGGFLFIFLAAFPITPVEPASKPEAVTEG